MFRLLAICALFAACGPGKEECDAAKSGAHKAWGEIVVKVGVEQKHREDELAKLESVLRVLEGRADAPPGAADAKRKEVADKRAEVERLAALGATAEKVRQSWRDATAAHAFELSSRELAQFAGTEADKARDAGGSAVSICKGVEE
ncbi:MAG: hypothetical protein ACOZNI_35505 [Myxococcota bacterium]